MSNPADTRALRDAALSLAELGISAHPTPNRAVAELTPILESRITAEVDAFSASANPAVVPELRLHIEESCRAMLTVLETRQPGDVEFVRRYARQRAQQRFPLEATLHTYRSAHRVLSEWLRDWALSAADPGAQVRRVVAAATDYVIEFLDLISTVATAEYVEHTRLIAEAESDRRSELLDILLGGYDEADSRAAALLRSGGYLAQRQSFCVVVARAVNPAEMENRARALRMLDAINHVLRDTPIRALSGLRDGRAVVILSAPRRLSGWTAAQSLLAERAFPRLLQVGPAALIGLSNDAPSTSFIRRAYQEARFALDFTRVAARVVQYAGIPFRQLAIRHAREQIQSALPSWLDGFTAADRKSRGSLSATLRAYGDANMNALQTAKNLSIHANTVYARMQRIHELTGKNPLHYNDLTDMLLAIDCAGD